ncbi:MAG: polysaccharide biosynthesis protein [Bacteroidaceae bacterium]|nr:polysaccharide biosynthesis protein [Bacteroidaceae bacterium]
MRNVFKSGARWYFSKGALSYWLVLLCDALIVLFSGILAHVLSSSATDTLGNFFSVMNTWCGYLLLYLVGFRVMHTYSGVIRYSSFIDLYRVAVANLIGGLLILAVRHLTFIDTLLMPLPKEEVFTAWFIATFFMWCLRVFVKYIYDVCYVSVSAQKVFIYGVKEGGIALAKGMRSQQSEFIVAGFVSDDRDDCSHLFMGAKVYFNDENLVEHMRRKNAKMLMVSPLKTDALRNNQEMIDRLTESGIKMRMYLGNKEWDGKSDLGYSQLSEVRVEDLLPRNQIEVDLNAISDVLRGRCVLITGAAGSIGSEMVRQVARFSPGQLVLIDQAETPLHDIRLMMARQFPDIPCETVTESICHELHMEVIFRKHKPEYVFHAAAYKHVPMMEDNPGAAVANNIHGTQIIADLAVKYGARKFVMVSTDKAVNPTNVMGCSKRICEMYCQSLDKSLKSRAAKSGGASQGCQFVTTRFGNVLGSNGSVIPIFQEQIKAGGPLTVTHPDIIRYFMLIPEACQLVLQAGTMGEGGEIYVFDMGKPVRIADLAKRMILLSGAKDIEIRYTGLRDGEKLYEELLNCEENTKPSSHPKIKLATVRELDYQEVCDEIAKLVSITKSGYDDMAIVRQMKAIVPEFKSNHSKYEALDRE